MLYTWRNLFGKMVRWKGKVTCLKKTTVLLKSYNFLFFGMLAMFIPFLPVYLQSTGLNTSEVGLIIALGGVVTVIAQPLWGMISDKLKTLRKIMLILVAMTAIFGYFLYQVDSFLLLVLLAMFVYFFLMPLDPLSESLTFTTTETNGISYGSVRTYGSLGYAILSLVIGYLTDWFGMGAIGLSFVVIGIICFAIVWNIPDVPSSSAPVTIDSLKKVLANKEMILFLILIFISSVPARMNDTFLGIHITTLGGENSLVGIAFFISGASEIVVFALSYMWLKQGKELQLITLAIFFYALRFFLTGFIDDPMMIVMIQALQMLTFPVYYTAAIQYLYRIMPREWRATGQTVLALLFFGVSGIISSYVGGIMYNNFGGSAFYYVIAAISFVAALYGAVLVMRHRKVA